MKILYGINSEGLGHLNRSKIVIKELQKLGHEITTVSSHKESDVFIDYLKLKYRNGKIRKASVIWDWLCFPMRKNINKIPNHGFDLVITDYEPVTARYARKHKINLVSIDNQHRFSTIDKSLPLKFLIYNIALYLVNKIFIGKTDDQIVTCFHPKEGSYDVLCEHEETKGGDGSTLVYLKDVFVLDFLRNYKDSKTPTYVYCKSLSIENFGYHNSNVKFCPLGDTFKRRLASCSRVVSNAGNQLIGECIKYNKPITCIPIMGQIEQEINAYYLKKFNLGGVTDIKNLEINNKKPRVVLDRGLDKVIERLRLWLK